jgi:hypothetical protein
MQDLWNSFHSRPAGSSIICPSLLLEPPHPHPRYLILHTTHNPVPVYCCCPHYTRAYMRARDKIWNCSIIQGPHIDIYIHPGRRTCSWRARAGAHASSCPNSKHVDYRFRAPCLANDHRSISIYIYICAVAVANFFQYCRASLND